jgi:uncharacterized membrane protein
MDFQKGVQLFIYLHASLGGVALLAGLVALLAQKGRQVHKKSGLVFFYSMLLSALTALIISVAPQHESPFLFAIGIFSSYFIITGYRALRFKKGVPKLVVDKLISWTMIVTGLCMVFLPIILSQKINIILSVFGIVGLVFAVRELRLFTDHKSLKRNWLKLHLGKMIGGYIAATTAFVVVNNVFPSFYGWFIPGIIGGLYITYWMSKLNKSTV